MIGRERIADWTNECLGMLSYMYMYIRMYNKRYTPKMAVCRSVTQAYVKEKTLVSYCRSLAVI